MKQDIGKSYSSTAIDVIVVISGNMTFLQAVFSQLRAYPITEQVNKLKSITRRLLSDTH